MGKKISLSIISFIFFALLISKEYSFSKKKENYLSSITSPIKSIDYDEKLFDSKIKLKQYYYDPVKIIKKEDNLIEYDFGKVRYGYLSFQSKKIFDGIVEIKELLNNINSPKDKWSYGYLTRKINVAKGEKLDIDSPERFFPRKKNLPKNINGIIPFRYVSLHSKSKIKPSDFKIKQISINTLNTLNFSDNKFIIDDKKIEKLWKVSKDSVEALSYSGIYLDGERERLPYEADTYFATKINSLFHDDLTVSRRTYDLLRNNPTFPLEWSHFLIKISFLDYKLSNDKDLLLKRYQDVRDNLFIQYFDDDSGLFVIPRDNKCLQIKNICKRPIINWPPSEVFQPYLKTNSRYSIKYIYYLFRYLEYKFLRFNHLAELYKIKLNSFINEIKTPIDNFSNQGYFLKSLEIAREIAIILEKKEDKKQYEEIIDKLQKNLLEKYFDKRENLFSDTPFGNTYSFNTQLIAFYSNLANPKQFPNSFSFLLENKNQASVYTSNILQEVLVENSPEDLYSYLTKNVKRSFLNAYSKKNISLGIEAWDEEIKPNMDQTHYWGAMNAFYISKGFFGYDPTNQIESELRLNPSFMFDFEVTLTTKFGNLDLNLLSVNSTNFVYEVGVNNFKNLEKISIFKRSGYKYDLIDNIEGILFDEFEDYLIFKIIDKNKRFPEYLKINVTKYK